MNSDIGVYSVYDLKGKVYDVPFFAKNDLFAKRRFIMDCDGRERGTMLAHFTADFILYKLGEFDVINGTFINGITEIYKGKEVQ